MIRKWISKYLLAVQLLLLLLGGILAILSAISPKGSQLSLALFSLGTAVMSSTLLSMLHSAFGTDVPTLVEQRLNFNRQVYDLGLETIHLHVGDESIFDRFEQARSIDMMYNTAKNVCSRYLDRMEQAISSRGCRIRILVSDPEHAIWSNNTVINALCPGTNIPGELKDVVNRLQLVVDELKRHSPRIKAGSLELRMYQCAPTCSIIIVDGDIARHTPYLPYSHSSEVPIYDVTRERGGALFTHYQRTFDRVWAQSKTVLKIDFPSSKQRAG